MGADGGSIPDRRDLVRTKGAAQRTGKAIQREQFLFCALSKKPLSKPVVADPLGKLYNKDAILEYLLDKSSYGDGEEICGYVRGVKDLLTLNLMPNPALEDDPSAVAASNRAPFVCWLSLKEMTGAVPFIAIRNCGCVFSESAVRSVIPNLARPEDISKDKAEGPSEAGCPNCTKTFDPTTLAAVLPLYPPAEVQELLLEGLKTLRAVQKANKKRKAGDSKEGKESKKGDEPPAKAPRNGSASASASPAPTARPTKAANSSVREMLAEQEKKRLAAQAGMSDAVKSMFTKKDAGKKSDVNDFFGRTFNRYAA